MIRNDEYLLKANIPNDLSIMRDLLDHPQATKS
jgi:hypothetical protein